MEITAEFTPELTPELTLEPVDVNGVQVIAGRMSFTLPITVANSFEVAQTTADLPGQPDIPPVAHIGFVDYLPDARPEFIHTFTAEAGVRVYNVVDLKEARATDPAFADAADQLAALIESRNALSAEATLPFLPQGEYSPVLHAREQYVQLRGGTGILYLAAFAEPKAPLIEGDIALVFQGLSDDGILYVSAVFPLDTNYLPATPPDNLDMAAFEAGYDLYVQSIRAALNEFQPTSSGPRLNDLYALIASMAIAP